MGSGIRWAPTPAEYGQPSEEHRLNVRSLFVPVMKTEGTELLGYVIAGAVAVWWAASRGKSGPARTVSRLWKDAGSAAPLPTGLPRTGGPAGTVRCSLADWGKVRARSAPWRAGTVRRQTGAYKALHEPTVSVATTRSAPPSLRTHGRTASCSTTWEHPGMDYAVVWISPAGAVRRGAHGDESRRRSRDNCCRMQ